MAPDPDQTPDADAERGLSAWEVEQSAVLDAMAGRFAVEAREWAARVRLQRRFDALTAAAEADGQVLFPQLEMAGSWAVSQLTATRLSDEALRLESALPLTLAALEAGVLFCHQGRVLLHRTRHCAPVVAAQVEAELLALDPQTGRPLAAGWCPSDLARRVDRLVLRIESEQADPAVAEQRQADAAAERRTFASPQPGGMGLAGAVLTAEQLTGWQHGLDQLEHRERTADQHAGVVRTAAQRRADLFAALPAMVLAGLAQDARSSRAAAGTGNGSGNGSGGTGTVTEAAARGDSPLGLVPWTLGPDRIAAQIVLNVHVPMATVLDRARAPGHLDGYGPISAEHVRLLRPHRLRRILVDATSGRPLAVDDRTVSLDPHGSPEPPEPPERGSDHTTQPADAERDREQRDRERRERDRRAARQLRAHLEAMLTPTVITDRDEPRHDPSARLARLVDLRDRHCAGPGCSSRRCDRDHHDPWPHGPTNAANLGLLSRRCHRAKHHGWTLTRHPDGSTTWHSPLHRTYQRPSPHDPPPDPGTDPDEPDPDGTSVDAHSPATTPRDRPVPALPWWGDDESAGAEADEEPTGPASVPDPDEPAPF